VAHGRLENLRSKLTQEPCPIRGRKVQENLIDTFTLGITNRTETITCDSTSQRTGEIANNETHGAPTNTTDQSPEPPCGTSSSAALAITFLRETFLSQHLLEDRAELSAIAIIAITTKPKVRPREAAARARATGGYFFWFFAFKNASGVVFTATCGVGESVVSVVYGLEFLSAGWSFGRVGGDSVGMGL
jgi:hypothetical protein